MSDTTMRRSRIGNNCTTNAKVYEKKKITVDKGLKKHRNCTLFNPFSPDGTLNCRFEKFLIFIWKGRGAQIPMSDATIYEALAG